MAANSCEAREDPMRMRAMAGLVLSIGAGVWSADAAAAQMPRGGTVSGVLRGPGAPPRDPQAPSDRPGTGVIKGTVIDLATGLPVPRARVAVLSMEQPQATTTDDEGRFTLTKLKRGSVSLMADKATYVPGFYPERGQSVRTRPVVLSEGQTIENLRLTMYRGGAIAGRVVDQYGDPVEAAQVEVIRLSARSRRQAQGPRRFSGNGSRTDDIGQFRVARLEPGSYLLVASPLRTRSDDGGPVDARTFYPGVLAADLAQVITLERGQSMTGLELAMLPATLTKLSGTVISARGGPVTSGSISVHQQTAGGGIGWADQGTTIRADGTFEFSVQPGEYVLGAEPREPREPGVWIGPPVEASERGLLPITVAGEAMTGLVITTGSGSLLSGRVVFDGTRVPAPAEVVKATVMIEMNGVSETCQAALHTPPIPINQDGAFSIAGLWGACGVRVNPPRGWIVKAMTLRGQDVWRRPIALTPNAPVSDLEVVLTDRLGDITFDVVDDTGAPLADYVAVVFPVEESRWRSVVPDVRYHVASLSLDAELSSRASLQLSDPSIHQAPVPGPTRPGLPASVPAIGVPPRPHRVSALTAGDYYVVVIDDVRQDDLQDAEFLATLVPLATRVTLDEGQQKTVKLRPATLPDTSR
jgi:protocatechuate 3,4-dioxygenase beta subunit